MSGLVLGLDGGGTQTRAALASLDGSTLGTGLAGACNLAAVTPPEALAAALAATDDALQQAGRSHAEIMSICAGVAGVSYSDRRAQFLSGLQKAFPNAIVSVEPDYAIALTGATDGAPGVIVIAGTGSAAYGQNASGETHRTGAYGYMIDDSGSGYGAGRGALAAVLQAADGTGPQTSLTERILAALGLTSLSEIVPGVYGGSLSRVSIAGLSRVVAEAAQEDADPVAFGLLMRAGGALAHITSGVTQRLFAGDLDSFAVVQIGGLWKAGEALTDVFTRSLRRFAPLAVLTKPLHSPAEGAVQTARQQLSQTQKVLPHS
ncbi:MAG: N-acetylglucosamine kinase [Janthinobacterium lividum]